MMLVPRIARHAALLLTAALLPVAGCSSGAEPEALAQELSGQVSQARQALETHMADVDNASQVGVMHQDAMRYHDVMSHHLNQMSGMMDEMMSYCWPADQQDATGEAATGSESDATHDVQALDQELTRHTQAMNDATTTQQGVDEMRRHHRAMSDLLDDVDGYGHAMSSMGYYGHHGMMMHGGHGHWMGRC